jgi:hypothetical protein
MAKGESHLNKEPSGYFRSSYGGFLRVNKLLGFVNGNLFALNVRHTG